MTQLGVGLTYVPGLDRILDACADLLEVVEIEPQTLWRIRADGTISTDEEVLRRLADLPGGRLLHGVGNPVGGSRLPDPRNTALVGELAERLGVPWVSEHLAFNQVDARGESFHTGFMLPPRQTPAGVRSAVRSVRAMAEELPVPLAVEIGANYLRPRNDELADGAFVRRVAEGSGCGLLLDLHNVLTNQRNGRGSADELIAALPLDRVWEVHLAGGLDHRGYWLDAHHGLPDEDLMALAERTLPLLPALRAVLFEVTPSAVPELDAQAVRAVLARLDTLWDRPEKLPPLSVPRPARHTEGPDDGAASPEDWEYALGSLAVGREPATPLGWELAADPAIGLLRELITEARGGSLAGALPNAMRLLFLTLGAAGLRDVLDAYSSAETPRLVASEEASAFARHLSRVRPDVPWLEDVLALDLGLLHVRLEGSPRTVSLTTDPNALLAALGAGRLPVAPPRGEFQVHLVDG
ncbi:hypothetical protein BGM19_33850 [Streptomyces agglomeratus]|uniref:DUF692 domain-containing protein n=1 Tax=Streptomyces agglomeratus TaxID=285458 RepID=UPI00086B597C|nr:DUF692 family multinuclear iron-containing protein [Streptomyces agglomeratus]OEJ62265.1 hypothetical protein BGM19_33850 [Streptomyces agglomeratus]